MIRVVTRARHCNWRPSAFNQVTWDRDNDGRAPLNLGNLADKKPMSRPGVGAKPQPPQRESEADGRNIGGPANFGPKFELNRNDQTGDELDALDQLQRSARKVEQRETRFKSVKPGGHTPIPLGVLSSHLLALTSQSAGDQHCNNSRQKAAGRGASRAFVNA